MEAASFCHTKHCSSQSFLPFNRTTASPSPKASNVLFPVVNNQLTAPATGLRLIVRRQVAAPGCLALRSGKVAELLLEEVTSMEEEEWWWRKGRLGEKCGGRKGMVELLECLEREAIMGDDEGKEPTDYDRRARIFDKSSRVFQVLKELESSSSVASGSEE